jgi:hypothetical protein
MRFSVIIPLVFAIGAFVLSFLCLFAGSKPSFMTDFDIVTVCPSDVLYTYEHEMLTGAPSSTPPHSALPSTKMRHRRAAALNLARLPLAAT